MNFDTLRRINDLESKVSELMVQVAAQQKVINTLTERRTLSLPKKDTDGRRTPNRD